MSRRRARILFAAVMSSALLAGLAVAESSGATTPDIVSESSETVADTVGSSEVISDTVAESEVATTSGTVAETSVLTTPVAAAVEILPPDEQWGGVTLGEWDARSFQWWVSMPEDINPSLDVVGRGCGYGQSGPVFFLTPWFGGQEASPVITCVVAEGTAVYVPVIGTECSTVELPPYFGRTEAELRACAVADLDRVTDVHARINGQEVADLEAYRIGSPLFTLTFPENNIFRVEPGVAQSVSESYAFIIVPPPPGEYEIVVSATLDAAPAPYRVTYNVIVEAPQVSEPPPTT